MRINFKDPATSVMEGIIDFHQDIQVYLLIIVTVVAWMLFAIVYEFGILHYIKIEKITKEEFKNKNSVIVFFKFFEENIIIGVQKIGSYADETKIVEIIKKRRESLITKSIIHGVILEIIWTILPVFILIAIAIPSFALLYSIDEIIDPTLTIKVMGHQWYWSYEYTDYNSEKISFDSYMITENDLQSR